MCVVAWWRLPSVALVLNATDKASRPLGHSGRPFYWRKSKPRPNPERKSRGRAAHVSARGEPDTELPVYLTHAGRHVKDHFGLCSAMTSARLRSRMRARLAPHVRAVRTQCLRDR